MDERFRKGVEEFNRQYFFEAHDVWEELWMETSGNNRLFYQGLIQTAVGLYHLSNGNYRGCCSQFGKALQKLDHYVPVFHGVATGRLVAGIAECLKDAERLRDGVEGAFDEQKIPCIQWSGEGL